MSAAEDENKGGLIGKDTLKSLIKRYKQAGAVSSVEKAASEGHIVNLPTSSLRPFPLLKEECYSPDSFKDLTASISQTGIRLPLFVFPENGKTLIVNGMKRWVAAKKLGLPTVPCIYFQGEEEEMIIYVLDSISKNRDNGLVLAEAFKTLEETYGLKEKDIREITGLSHGQVANLIRISSLPPDIKEMIRDGRLSPAKARLLLPFGRSLQFELAAAFVPLDVRGCEELAREKRENVSSSPHQRGKMTYKVEGKRITIEAEKAEDLEEIISFLKERGTEC
jgi:ParB family chromosome partitioning protein